MFVIVIKISPTICIITTITIIILRLIEQQKVAT